MFNLNPYDATLEPLNREDRKLFNISCKGLDKRDAFDGNKGTYLEFVKLIEKDSENIHVMCALNIATEWPAVGRVLTYDGMIDIFQSIKE